MFPHCSSMYLIPCLFSVASKLYGVNATIITFVFVLYCIVLYCIVLYCIVLYCIVLYCIVLYCIVLYCIVLYCIVLYCIVLYCIVLYCIVLYCIVLYCIVFSIASSLDHFSLNFSTIHICLIVNSFKLFQPQRNISSHFNLNSP